MIDWRDIERKAENWYWDLQGEEKKKAVGHYVEGVAHCLEEVYISTKAIEFEADRYAKIAASKIESLTQIELAEALATAFHEGMKMTIEKLRHRECELHG